MAATTTVKVPHLGGIDVGYKLSGDKYDSLKPTCVLMNSMCTTVSLYDSQFSNSELTAAMNLLAIEPLGHGSTSCSVENFTYWDSAIMALQVMDALKIEKAFMLGTSQGGWIVTRVAVLAPERILGLVLLGTSLDYESEDSRSKGCWNPGPILQPFVDGWTSTSETPDFLVDDVWCGLVGSVGFGAEVQQETMEFWKTTLKDIYRGDEGRMKVRMAVINLVSRDGLLMRLGSIKAPVYWLQGSEDSVYGTQVPLEQIKLFANSKETKFTVVPGGAHYLNASSPTKVDAALLELVAKYK
ncbi:putative alpha/beta hydrolase [Calycina marina]|uniref:Alpha/beta hydrolase n=1 Tax=Calycina marina TaxID=1763456 RepID=A0A9P8CG87_9HELO|nr:putative alpha/beta hydrolase [Calycina marina]